MATPRPSPPRLNLTSSEIVATLAACGVAAAELRRHRQRQHLGRALHELRRPLQALLLTSPPAPAQRLSSVDLALAALRDLESIFEGKPRPRGGLRGDETVGWQRLIDDAADRWQQAAWLRGGRIDTDCHLDEATVLPQDVAITLSGALDNLILNSLTHGGATVNVSAARRTGTIELVVVDRGRPPAHLPLNRPDQRPGRHGHGLKVVARIADQLGGRFEFQRDAGGSTAKLCLPRARG